MQKALEKLTFSRKKVTLRSLLTGLRPSQNRSQSWTGSSCMVQVPSSCTKVYWKAESGRWYRRKSSVNLMWIFFGPTMITLLKRPTGTWNMIYNFGKNRISQKVINEDQPARALPHLQWAQQLWLQGGGRDWRQFLHVEPGRESASGQPVSCAGHCATGPHPQVQP